MTPEKVVLGRYRILERVGRGSMGVIYRGLDPVLDREVAIKVMSADFALEGDEAKKRFFREARAAAKLQHRNIVTVFEFAEEDGIPYIVMEFLRGRNLADRINNGPLMTTVEKLDIVAGLCDGLNYASENGVIHRDVKPANVWLLDDGSVKLVDFGIAKLTTATSTLGKDVIGSAAYMSPEQAEGQTVDARSDVFSAAVVLYELVAGKRPFEASTPTATLLKIVQDPPPPIHAADVPPGLVVAIFRALEKNPAARYQTAGDFGSDLRLIRSAIVAGSETGSSGDASFLLSSTTTRKVEVKSDTASASTPTPRKKRTHPRWALAGVVGGLLLSAVLYWAGTQFQHQTLERPPNAQPAGDTSGVPLTAATLTLASDPPGAQIFLDGASTGQETPTVWSLEKGVPKSIRLTKKGYKPILQNISQADVNRGNLTFTLVAEQPASVKVTLSGNYPFQVLSGGRALGEGSQDHWEFAFQAGQRITLRSAEHFLNKDYVIDAGQRGLTAPELGDVSFGGQKSDGCVIIRDGKSGRALPFTLSGVASGQQLFEFKCGDLLIKKQITVVPGPYNKVIVP